MTLLLSGVGGGHGGHAMGAGSGVQVEWLVATVVALVLIGPYMSAVRLRIRRGRPWSRRRLVSWTVGALLVAAALSPPMAAAVHLDPRGHMAQHLLLGMYAPLALVLGAPVTLVLASSSTVLGRRVVAVLRSPLLHVLSHPVVAGVLHVVPMVLLYTTSLYASTQRSAFVHAAVTLHLVLAGYLFAWSIAGPDPGPRRPGLATRVVVLVLAGGAHAGLATLLYARADGLPPGADLEVSQAQAAAQWMYYGGDVAEILLAVALFHLWYRRRLPVSRRRRELAGAC